MIIPSLSLLAQPDKAELKELYKRLLKEVDKDHDGKINQKDFLDLFAHREEAEKKFKAHDADRDGYVTFEEYASHPFKH
jgi:Ca2+-binding EF-hand superfamily protein